MDQPELPTQDRDSQRYPAAPGGQLEQAPSPIGRLVSVAALWDPAANRYRAHGRPDPRADTRHQRFLADLHERAFEAWLSCPPERQLEDLLAHIREVGFYPGLFFSADSYTSLVPPTAAEPERRLFFCSLDIVLAQLRNQCGDDHDLGHWRVRRMIETVRQSRAGGRVSLKELSERMGLSDHQLGSLFRRRTQLTFHQYQRRWLTLRAVELLRDPVIPLKDIASRLGYSDGANFGREFREILGITPHQFRARSLRGRGGGAGYQSARSAVSAIASGQ